MMIPHYKGNIPFINTTQMKEVDRIMTEDYGITLLQMMENAGLNLAILARDLFLIKNPDEKKVIVAAGPGGNGGGALAAARRLKNWGVNVKVILSEKNGKFKKETVNQFSILQKMKIPVITKIDKVSRSQRAKHVGIIAEETGLSPDAFSLFSASTREGSDEIWERIEAALDPEGEQG
jgi:NAD(P)H-hydrate epimerase